MANVTVITIETNPELKDAAREEYKLQGYRTLTPFVEDAIREKIDKGKRKRAHSEPVEVSANA